MNKRDVNLKVYNNSFKQSNQLNGGDNGRRLIKRLNRNDNTIDVATLMNI